MAGVRNVLPAGYSLITTDEAIARLKARIAFFKTSAAYARYLKVRPSFVTNCLKGRANISGKIALDLGLRHVHAYQCKTNNEGTKQGDYEEAREKHREINPVVDEKGQGLKYPDRGPDTKDATEQGRAAAAAAELARLRAATEREEQLALFDTSQDQNADS